MKRHEVFILMSIEGISYDRIAAALNVHISDVTAWGQHFAKEIEEGKQTARKQGLHSSYRDILNRIEDSIAGKDFAELSLDTLLTLRKIYKRKLTEDSPEEIYSSDDIAKEICGVYKALKNKDITAEEARISLEALDRLKQQAMLLDLMERDKIIKE